MQTESLQHRSPFLRMAVAQTRATPGDITRNVADAARVVREAGERGVRVLLFPELSLTGYEPGWLRASLPAKAVDPYGTELDPIRAACRDSGVTAIVGAPTAHGTRSAISALVIDDLGETAAVGHKQHLEVHEREVFAPGGPCATTVDGWRLAIGICYDASFPEPVRAAALAGADAFLCGGAFVAGDSDHRRSVYFPARALENTMYVLFANFVGQQGPWEFCGRSAVYGPDGRPLATADSRVPEIAVADLDEVALAEIRERLTMLADLRGRVSFDPALTGKPEHSSHSTACVV